MGQREGMSVGYIKQGVRRQSLAMEDALLGTQDSIWNKQHKDGLAGHLGNGHVHVCVFRG